MMYDTQCPWCGVALRGTDVKVGMVLGCPNQTGGCGRPSKIYPDRLIPMQMRVTKVS